jgi:hypothetical protein
LLRALVETGPERDRGSVPACLFSFVASSVLALVLVLTPHQAGAAVRTVRIQAPAVVVLSARSATFGVAVTGVGRTNRWRTASCWTETATADRPQIVGEGKSKAQTVPVRIDGALLAPYGRTFLRCWAGSGGSDAVTIAVRRQSRVSMTAAVRDGRVRIAARATHWSPDEGRQIASRQSPVQVQELQAGGWVTVETATTSADGLASAVVTAGPGENVYRVIRPSGATVSAATSSTHEVRISSSA